MHTLARMGDFLRGGTEAQPFLACGPPTLLCAGVPGFRQACLVFTLQIKTSFKSCLAGLSSQISILETRVSGVYTDWVSGVFTWVLQLGALTVVVAPTNPGALIPVLHLRHTPAFNTLTCSALRFSSSSRTIAQIPEPPAQMESMIAQEFLLSKPPKIKLFLPVIILGQKTSVWLMGHLEMPIRNKTEVTTVDSVPTHREAFTSEIFIGFLLVGCSKAFPCLL